MQIKDGKIIFAPGEKMFPAVYLGHEILKGNRKSDNTPYNYAKHRFDLILTKSDGSTYVKYCEALLDPKEKFNFSHYTPIYVVYSIMMNPLKAPSVIYFLPRKEEVSTPTNPEPTLTPEQVSESDLPF